MYALDELREPNEAASVKISRVIDPKRLLDERASALHGDVIDALVDFIVELEKGSDDVEGDDR